MVWSEIVEKHGNGDGVSACVDDFRSENGNFVYIATRVGVEKTIRTFSISRNVISQLGYEGGDA